MKTKEIALVLILVAVIAVLFYMSQGLKGPEEPGLPNPAAVYCLDQGGQMLSILTPAGTAGYCILPDNRMCKQWPFFNSKGEDCIELEIDFTFDDDCKAACTQAGNDKGGCMWPTEADELMMPAEGPPPETLHAIMGTCLVEQSRHCGNMGQCYCYCYNVSNCAKEGEPFSMVYKDYPDHCCEGLTEWHSGMDTSISIADECYQTGLLAGSPIGTCINCGNGICEDIENPCNCPEDCKGKNKSDFLSIEEFCQSERWIQTFSEACEEIIKDFPICELC